jgi:outer membrane protein
VRSAQATIQTSQLDLKQAKAQRIPTLNASSVYGYNFGLSINPITNERVNQTNSFNSFGANANVTLFSGGQINNTIEQNKLLLEASKLDYDNTVNNLALDIATAYLNILLGEEQLALARQQITLSQAQLEQVNRLIRAGSRPEADRFDIVAQIARNEQTAIQAENTIANGYLNLKQLMNVEPNLDIRVQRPEVNVSTEVNPDEFALNEVYTTALTTQPQIRANALRLQASDVAISISKGAFYPTLSLFGSLDTRYGRFSNFPNQISYFNQLGDNFGQGFGISLNIPIFNNFRNRIGVERSQVNLLNTEIRNDQVSQQLKTNIQTAIANARNARRSYDAALRSVEANQIAFQNAQRRFDLGAVNSLEFTTARNNLDQAQNSLIQAKYQYVFNVKVVEFYQGKTLQLN